MCEVRDCIELSSTDDSVKTDSYQDFTVDSVTRCVFPFFSSRLAIAFITSPIPYGLKLSVGYWLFQQIFVYI
jgi:hypothetical protein